MLLMIKSSDTFNMRSSEPAASGLSGSIPMLGSHYTDHSAEFVIIISVNVLNMEQRPHLSRSEYRMSSSFIHIQIHDFKLMNNIISKKKHVDQTNLPSHSPAFPLSPGGYLQCSSFGLPLTATVKIIKFNQHQFICILFTLPHSPFPLPLPRLSKINVFEFRNRWAKCQFSTLPWQHTS